MNEKSDSDKVQEMFPGATRVINAKMLCPRCGWHFPKGFADPTGTITELQPGGITICGECLAVLKLDDQCKPVLQTTELMNDWPMLEQVAIRELWIAHYMMRELMRKRGVRPPPETAH